MFIYFVPSSAICCMSEHRAPCCGKWVTSTVTTLNYCNIELTNYMVNVEHMTVPFKSIFLNHLLSGIECAHRKQLHQTFYKGTKRLLFSVQTENVSGYQTSCGHFGQQTFLTCPHKQPLHFTKQHFCLLRFMPGALSCFSIFGYLDLKLKDQGRVGKAPS